MTYKAIAYVGVLAVSILAVNLGYRLATADYEWSGLDEEAAPPSAAATHAPADVGQTDRVAITWGPGPETQSCIPWGSGCTSGGCCAPFACVWTGVGINQKRKCCAGTSGSPFYNCR
jgi:hypothetical protein